ncbi:MAG: SDR family oxidoreductase [Chlorobiaceae bacterium]|nr:SDR family oxidoreductase [Chlorobiaceae bacterium]
MSEVLLITGGASGIGAATARLAARKGYDIAINYRSREREAELLVEELKKTGVRVIAVQADIACPGDIERMFEEVTERLGVLTALVNSAGVLSGRTRVDEADATLLTRLFQTNVTGLILSTREAVRRMSTAHGGKGGVIVNVSSMAATIGGRPGVSLYGSSKAAVDVFTVGLAREVAAEGIRAVAVRPGFTITEMTAEYTNDPDRYAEIASSIPLGRPANVDEIARPIVWLLSDEASFITGALLDVSGGGFNIGGTPLKPPAQAH